LLHRCRGSVQIKYGWIRRKRREYWRVASHERKRKGSPKKERGPKLVEGWFLMRTMSSQGKMGGKDDLKVGMGKRKK